MPERGGQVFCELPGIIFQKTTVFIATAVPTSSEESLSHLKDMHSAGDCIMPSNDMSIL
jgi:hypothetical protein